MSNEAATGADILSDATAGGLAGAGVGGLLGGGLTASALEQIAKGDDKLLRKLLSGKKTRRALIGALATMGALGGGAAGFTLAGGSRWIGGRPRPVQKTADAQKQLARIRGLPSQFRTAKSVAPAASPPVMKLPGTLAREHNAAGMVTKGATMRYVKRAAKQEEKPSEGHKRIGVVRRVAHGALGVPLGVAMTGLGGMATLGAASKKMYGRAAIAGGIGALGAVSTYHHGRAAIKGEVFDEDAAIKRDEERLKKEVERGNMRPASRGEAARAAGTVGAMMGGVMGAGFSSPGRRLRGAAIGAATGGAALAGIGAAAPGGAYVQTPKGKARDLRARAREVEKKGNMAGLNPVTDRDPVHRTINAWTGAAIGGGLAYTGARSAINAAERRLGRGSAGTAGKLMAGAAGLAGGVLGAKVNVESADERWKERVGKRRERYAKKKASVNHFTGTSGDLEGSPGLFHITAQALMDRGPSSVDEVLADSDAYRSLPKA